MNQPDHGPVGVPGGTRAGDTDRQLQGVESDLDLLDELGTGDQVPVYDRMHTTLADALARTADTGVPPAPGQSGA